MSSIGQCALVGVDWGSTNLRAYAFNKNGGVLAEQATNDGLLNILDGHFAQALSSVLSLFSFDVSQVPIVMCGMIGSKQGWREAAYVDCPATSAAMAASLCAVEFANRQVWIVPGVHFNDGRHDDVMRGEETQLIGVAMESGLQTVVTPGTHSKWVTMHDSQIMRFATYMTGEFYQLLRTQSILKHSMPLAATPFDADAFENGVRQSIANPAVLQTLFGVRTKSLFNRMPPEALPHYLSGLLIGAEAVAASTEQSRVHELTVIASDELAALYVRALSLLGCKRVNTIAGAVASAKGLWKVWQLRSKL